MSRGQSFVLLLSLVAIATLLAPAGARSQSDRSVVFDSYDVTIDVKDNGTFHVSELFTAEFAGEPAFTYGYADLPLDHVTDYVNFTVTEISATSRDVFRHVPSPEFSRSTPGEFTIFDQGSILRVEYGFAPALNETRTFELTYDALGALRVYPNETPPNEQVWWIAIGTEVTDIAPIRSATVAVNLPTAVPVESVVLGEDADGPASDHTSNGQQWSWSQANLDQGDNFEIRMQFPPITNASAPAWQASDDAEREAKADEEARRNRLGAFATVLGLIVAVGGGLYLFIHWASRGKDPEVELVAEYLSEPPDDLPPGLVGTLLHEHGGRKELVATFVDLARRDFLTLIEKEDGEIAVKSNPVKSKPLQYERLMLEALFPSKKSGVFTSLTEGRKSISPESARIETHMERELTQQGYFVEAPTPVRNRWLKIAGFLGIGAVLSARVLGPMIGNWSIALIVSFALLAVAVFLFGRAMPKRTEKGALAKAQWEAFGRYLEEIQKFATDSPLAEQRDLFDRYLPYAIVFDLEDEWLEIFSALDTPAPSWYVGTRSGGGQSAGGAGGGGGSVGMPSLSGASSQGLASLSSVSSGLASMFNEVGTAFTPATTGSGTGFSGGGRGGGGGGGGGRGFG